MRVISSIILLFVFTTVFCQGNHPEGLLKIEKVKTYWDKDSTIVRSLGFYNKSGYGSVGERTGLWRFWTKKGVIEETVFYWMGFRHGKTQQFYPNGKLLAEGYYYLGIEDSLFKAYYNNGNLAEKGNYAGIPDAFLEDTANADWAMKLDQFEAVKIGKWEYFFENGNPMMVTNHKENDSTEYMMEYYDTSGIATVTGGFGSVINNYSTGKPKEEAHYNKGLRDGNFKEWNANGTLKTSGAYKEGKRSGPWEFRYFVTDQVYQEINYENGLRKGVFKEYLPDSTLVLNGMYANDLKNGKWEYFFETGAKDMTGNFVDDLQDGKWSFWYPNGQLYYEGNFIKGGKDGFWQFFYKTGETWKEGSYKINLREGEWTTWFENGQEAMKGNYLQDKENGVWSAWFENGQLKDEGAYDMAKMKGNWKGWYPNGKKRYQGNYTNDMRDGKWSFWTDKGVLKDVGSFKILKRKGDITFSEGDGYEQSFRHGHWKSYSDVDGELTSEGDYSYGKQDGKWEYYYPGGVVVATENVYGDGMLNGVSKTYTRRGEVQNEIGYKNNKKHGPMKVYNRKGKLMLHVVYKNGVRTKSLVMKGQEAKIMYKYGAGDKPKKNKSKKVKGSSILR